MKKRDKKHLAYKDCEVCSEWHNFQVFADWYENNYYDIGEGRMHIDKDILGKGSKIYSPDTCIFVPQRINMIFMTKARKDELPNGITKNIDSYTSHYNGKKLKKCNTLEEAINIHNEAKRNHIKQIAEEYKEKIPNRVYEALINW
jgi:hypothetical protein